MPRRARRGRRIANRRRRLQLRKLGHFFSAAELGQAMRGMLGPPSELELAMQEEERQNQRRRRSESRPCACARVIPGH